MLSSVFVDRPRLAAVISIVMTIAGLLSLLVIPIAQYPDIVPPQVQVSTIYPGASSAVVEATVAQPIEAQIVGVDKLMYMKSVSGNDGSYSLLLSFELGTDPDINTVNVNNRVQVALAKLPSEVRQQGVTVKKKSSALLGVVAVYSPKGTLRPAVHQQLRHHQPAGPDPQHARRRRCDDVRAAGLLHAGLGADRPADRAQPDHRRHRAGHPEPERAGRGRAHRRAADLRRPAVAAQHPDQGAADLARGIRADHPAHQSGRLGAAAGRRGPARTGRAEPRPRHPVQRQAGGADRGLPVARRQRADHAGCGEAAARRPAEDLPRGSGLEGHLRPHHLRARHHPRGGKDAGRSLRAGGGGGVPVPGKLARHPDPHHRRAGQPDRLLRRAERHRLFGQLRCRCWRWCWRSASWWTTPSW